MNVILVSIDSLRRDMLTPYESQPYGFDYDVETPNIDAFANRAATFNSNYAGSAPCMPARREWLSGIQEFLWRPWGPIEPFDETLASAARNAGAVTQLVTDHFHYFQHGSHGYFEDFDGFEFVRGNEFDAWKTGPVDIDSDRLAELGADNPHELTNLDRVTYARNTHDFEVAEDYFTPQVFDSAIAWLEDNQGWDDFFLFVDNFDVHEPFDCPEPYASMYTDEDPDDPDLPNWPFYGKIDEGESSLTDRQLEFVRSQYAASVTMVDDWFGRLTDKLDELGLWEETMVVFTSDHGFCLGEYGWMGKNDPPMYDVIANTPLFVWDPESNRMGEQITELTSAIDLHATMAEALGAERSNVGHSRSLLPLLRDGEENHREWALYGYWGSTVNVTDGEYTYHHPTDPDASAVCFSTTMLNPHQWFDTPTPKREAEAGSFLPYTDTPVWRFEDEVIVQNEDPLLFECEQPPEKDNCVNSETEDHERMRGLLKRALTDLEAPQNVFERLGLEATA